MEKPKNANRSPLADPPLSGGAVSSDQEEARLHRAAFLLCRTLALGILRKRYPEAIHAGTCGLGERRVIMNLLFEWTDPETVRLAGGEDVIEAAILRGREG